LKFEDLRSLSTCGAGQRCYLPPGGDERGAKGASLVLRRADRSGAICRGVDAHELPMGKTDRGRSTPVCQFGDVRSHVH
jgi:hypothetical protein